MKNNQISSGDTITQNLISNRQSLDQRKSAEKLHTLLALLCKEEAPSYARMAEDGNGLQAWQALLKAKTLRDPMSLIVGSAFHVDL